MSKNIVIVDIDVEFQNIMKRTRGTGYVTLEYYFSVSDGVFTKLENTNILYSDDDGDISVLDILDRLTPFDGISSGRASLARQELDAGTDGHSRKIKDIITGAGDVGQVLRICHTQNMLKIKPEANALKMYCRSFRVDPETLDQTPAVSAPADLDFEIDDVKPNRQQLFDFLAIRKTFHQTAQTDVTFSLRILSPIKDYDSHTMQTVESGLTFDAAVRLGAAWVKDGFAAGKLALDKDTLTVTGRETGKGAKRGYVATVVFKDTRPTPSFTSAAEDQTRISLDGKTLTVMKSQPLVVFDVVPHAKSTLQYELSESDMIQYWAHMLDESMR